MKQFGFYCYQKALSLFQQNWTELLLTVIRIFTVSSWKSTMGYLALPIVWHSDMPFQRLRWLSPVKGHLCRVIHGQNQSKIRFSIKLSTQVYGHQKLNAVVVVLGHHHFIISLGKFFDVLFVPLNFCTISLMGVFPSLISAGILSARSMKIYLQFMLISRSGLNMTWSIVSKYWQFQEICRQRLLWCSYHFQGQSLGWHNRHTCHQKYRSRF